MAQPDLSGDGVLVQGMKPLPINVDVDREPEPLGSGALRLAREPRGLRFDVFVMSSLWMQGQELSRTYANETMAASISPSIRRNCTDCLHADTAGLERQSWRGRLQREQRMAAQNTSTLQDTFLKHLCDNKADVTVFLANGIRLQGQIKSFDNFTIQLARGNSSQIVYKHAISAINPAEPIQLFDLNAES
jgi:host factor-I protein